MLAGPAQAHAPLAGFSSFGNGFLHPLVIPAQVLLIISLGLLIGRQGSRAIQYALLLFFVSLFPGIFLSQFVTFDAELILSAGAASLAAVVISGYFLPLWCLYAFAILSGLLIGTDSLIEDFVHKQRYFAWLGSVVGSYVLLIYSSGIAQYLQPLKDGIAIRVAGSWIAASCLLVIALSVLKPF